MDDDWVYQNEEFDEDLPYIELQFGIEDLYMIYDSVKYRYEKWPGGHPGEQVALQQLKDNLFRIILEKNYTRNLGFLLGSL